MSTPAERCALQTVLALPAQERFRASVRREHRCRRTTSPRQSFSHPGSDEKPSAGRYIHRRVSPPDRVPDCKISCRVDQESPPVLSCHPAQTLMPFAVFHRHAGAVRTRRPELDPALFARTRLCRTGALRKMVRRTAAEAKIELWSWLSFEWQIVGFRRKQDCSVIKMAAQFQMEARTCPLVC